MGDYTDLKASPMTATERTRCRRGVEDFCARSSYGLLAAVVAGSVLYGAAGTTIGASGAVAAGAAVGVSFWAVLMVCGARSTAAEVLRRRTAARSAAAANPNCTPELHERLAEDPQPEVRSVVAAHRDVSMPAQALLAADPSRKVRKQLAANPYCRDNVLACLAVDADAAVRKRVAAHPRSAEHVLRLLAGDADPVVRQAAAANPNATASVLTAAAPM